MTIEELQKQYTALCAQLGHYVNNLKKLNAAIAKVEADIETIDKAVAALNQEAAKKEKDEQQEKKD